MKIAVASDHRGLTVKERILRQLADLGQEGIDLGPNSPESVDYPDYAAKVASAVANHEADRGILICGSGIGISIAVNRHNGLRAALVHDAETAKLARQHNDANVLALGARSTPPDVARTIMCAFFETEFEGGRHSRRVEKLG